MEQKNILQMVTIVKKFDKYDKKCLLCFFTIKFSQHLVFISYFSLSEIYLKKLKNYNILSLHMHFYD